MRAPLDFFKYQGCGNDFVIVDEMTTHPTADRMRGILATKLCDRHFGIGADGLIFLEPADDCDGAMRLFEPAGNEAEMCGNGLRCVAAFLSTSSAKDEFAILTPDGIKRVAKTGDEYRADMGPIRFLRGDLQQYIKDDGKPTDSMMDFPLYDDSSAPRASMLSTGEPHIVVFTDDISSVNIAEIGASLNADRDRFPLGVNINFVQEIGPDEMTIRTYERGVYDETMACGTGATACAAASILSGRTASRIVNVITRGGRLRIEVARDGHAFMTGPAIMVFTGRIEVDI